MTPENENSTSTADGKKRVAPACEVYDMLTAHAAEYVNTITISKVQRDIEATFGVRLARNAISSRLRHIAAKGLIQREANGRGWWVFSANTRQMLGQKGGGPAGRSLLKTPKPKSTRAGKPFGEKGPERECIEAFIRKNKQVGCAFVLTKDSVADYMRLNGHRAVTKRQLHKIAKALSNMRDQHRGLVGTGRPGVFCVPASENRFNTSTAPQPDVAVAQVVPRRPAAQPSKTVELQRLLQAAADGCAAVQRAMIGLSDLLGNFKE